MSVKTALVVDDSKSARFALRKYLENHSFKVDTVDGAEEAYGFLRLQRPQVIFLDHVMPGIDGFQALHDIKHNPQTADIPVVICSSNDGEDFRAEAMQKGASQVLQKPPRPEHLTLILAALQNQPVPQPVAAAPKPAPLPDELSIEDFDLALEMPAAPAVVAAPPAPVAAAPKPQIAPVVTPSKVANIREPEVAIEQAVMKALRGAMQPRVEAAAPAAPTATTPDFNPANTGNFTRTQSRPAEPHQARPADAAQFTAMREQLEARMKKITQDVFVQLAELKGAIAHLESRDAGASPEIMRQIAEDSLSSVHQRIDALENTVRTQFADLSARMESRLSEQAKRTEQVIEAAKTAAAEEARTAAERTMMSAAARIAEQLAEPLLKARAEPGKLQRAGE